MNKDKAPKGSMSVLKALNKEGLMKGGGMSRPNQAQLQSHAGYNNMMQSHAGYNGMARPNQAGLQFHAGYNNMMSDNIPRPQPAQHAVKKQEKAVAAKNAAVEHREDDEPLPLSGPQKQPVDHLDSFLQMCGKRKDTSPPRKEET